MFNVWYLVDPDYPEELAAKDWEAVNLFIAPDEGDKGPQYWGVGTGDQVIVVSYSGEGWLGIQDDMHFKKWPFKVPQRFWQRVIKGIFSGDL